ncbi:integral peroxisomal membrane peroxin-domain-containing protein [Phlyctochytrium arcticum]|nr:integral peroxisomal membrane peroxin-domain-containing protein [Phlyctochytrium arcticum]
MQKEIQDGSRDPDEGMMTYSLQEPQDVIPMGVHQHALLLKSSLEEDPTGTLTRYYAEPEEVVVLPPTTTTEEEEIPQTYPVMTDLEEEDYDPAHHLSYQQHSQFQQDQDQDPFPFPINDPVPYQQQQPPLQQQHHRRHTFTSSPRSSLRGSNRKSLPLTLRFTTYENQRWFVGLGWVPHLLPGERPSYSDETGTTALPKESFKIPNFRGDELKNLSLSKGESPLLGVSEEITALGLDSHHQARVHWDWDSEWTVLPVLTGDPETLTDAQGWQYGDNFWSNYKNRKTLKRVTRRRKWVRSARLYDGGRKRSVTFGDRVVVFRPTDDKAFIELSSEDDDEEVVVRQPLMMEGEMEEEREWEEEQARLYQNLYAPRNPYGRPVSATS